MPVRIHGPRAPTALTQALRSLIEISARFYWHKGTFQKIKYQLGKPYLTIEVINYLILDIGVVMTFIVCSHHNWPLRLVA